jgi:Organic solute transporter Ostalpha
VAAPSASPPPPRSLSSKRLTLCEKISGWLVTFTYVGGIALACWIIQTLVTNNAENHQYAFAIAGVFVGLSLPLSLHDLHGHMMHYVSPMQNHVMRLIWMVPIYSVQSWLALGWPQEGACVYEP